MIPKPDCVHLWIPQAEDQPMRCIRCKRTRPEVTFLDAMALILTIGFVMLALALAIVAVAQVAIFVTHHRLV